MEAFNTTGGAGALIVIFSFAGIMVALFLKQRLDNVKAEIRWRKRSSTIGHSTYRFWLFGIFVGTVSCFAAILFSLWNIVAVIISH